ncbi:MAG: hypothetical protein ACYS7Y_04160 [Planctomycetota bacterium]|jgi:hypothetical protein
MKATAVETKTYAVKNTGGYHCRVTGQNFCLTMDMEEGTYTEYKSFPNLVDYDGRRYGKSAWNSDTMEVVYTTGAVSNYATEAK